MTSSRVVAVIGPGSDAAREVRTVARRVGLLLARRGVVVLTGGLEGVMDAAARGAHEGGGVVIGLLPGADRTGASEYLSVAIPTGLGQARNALVVGAADGIIAVGGSWGTLSEVALARRAGKPIVCVAGWQVTDADRRPVPLVVASTAEQAVTLLVEVLGWADH